MKCKTKMKCMHIWVKYRDSSDRWWNAKRSTLATAHPGEVRLLKCQQCSATLSLGPSNDKPDAVQVEMRAADNICTKATWHGKPVDILYPEAVPGKYAVAGPTDASEEP